MYSIEATTSSMIKLKGNERNSESLVDEKPCVLTLRATMVAYSTQKDSAEEDRRTSQESVESNGVSVSNSTGMQDV